ncbi:MAG: hypothetical protein WKF58_09615 [Ilumatobacteraceae bacterium]
MLDEHELAPCVSARPTCAVDTLDDLAKIASVTVRSWTVRRASGASCGRRGAPVADRAARFFAALRLPDGDEGEGGTADAGNVEAARRGVYVGARRCGVRRRGVDAAGPEVYDHLAATVTSMAGLSAAGSSLDVDVPPCALRAGRSLLVVLLCVAVWAVAGGDARRLIRLRIGWTSRWR